MTLDQEIDHSGAVDTESDATTSVATPDATEDSAEEEMIRLHAERFTPADATVDDQEAAEPGEPDHDDTAADASDEPDDTKLPASSSVSSGGKRSKEVTLASGKKLSVNRDEAIAALKRGQFPDGVIDAMDEEELLSRGLKIARTQREQDHNFNEMARVKKMLQQIEADEQVNPKPSADTQDAEGDTANPDTDPEASTTDLADDHSAIEPFLAQLREDDLLADLADPLQQIYKTQETQINQLHLKIDQMHLSHARQRLGERFPKLQDPEAFSKVSQRVYQIAQLDGYTLDNGDPDWDMLVTDAARLEGLDSETRQEQQKQLADRYKRQTDGLPQVTPSRGKPTRAMGEVELLEYAQKLLSQGKSPTEVQTTLSLLPK